MGNLYEFNRTKPSNKHFDVGVYTKIVELDDNIHHL